METKFKDVAHLYKKVDILICEPGVEPVSHYLEGVDWHLDKAIAERVSYPFEWVKPILSRLEDMTEEDRKTAYSFSNDVEHIIGWCTMPTFEGFLLQDAKAISYLLSKGYDLFNLIPSGEAIDRKTIKE